MGGSAILAQCDSLSDCGVVDMCLERTRDTSLSLATMATGRVARLAAEHISSLVTRLRSYNAHSLQTRAILRLLQTRVNRAPFRIFAAGAEGTDLVTVTVMTPTPGFSVLDVCGREDSVCRRRLDSLLRSPELADLWKQPFRVEAVAEGLSSVISAAAADRGLRRIVDSGDLQRVFARPEGLPCPPREDLPGLAVRSLQPCHLPRVRRMWPPSDLQPDTNAVLADSQQADLAVGVFLTESSGVEPDSAPVSWGLLNTYGAQSFSYTEVAYRGRGLQAQVQKELLRRTVKLDLPPFGHVTDTNVDQLKNVLQLGYIEEHIVKYLHFQPTDC